MIELPEALTYAKELNQMAAGKTVKLVCPPSSPHKFCWFYGAPEDYDKQLKGCTVESAEGFGIYVEIRFDRGRKLAFNDGVKVRFLDQNEARPKKYQLYLEFTDGTALAFSVAMYGSIICHSGSYDNEYYLISRDGMSPLSDAFDEKYFDSLAASVKPAVSVKALLATEQRIPGLGNGCLQDILFHASIHPKRKVGTLTEEEKSRLFCSIKEVMREMAESGGRDTEKNLMGNPGGYRTLMSKNTWKSGCPRCHGEIVKENYLGGSVYYCPACQRCED